MDSELWAPLGPGGRCSPGLTAARKGQHTHARAHTLTPDTRRLTRGLGAGRQDGPFNMWPSTGTIANGVWAAALPCPEVPLGGGLLQLGWGQATHRILSVYLVQNARLPSPHTFYLITCHC